MRGNFHCDFGHYFDWPIVSPNGFFYCPICRDGLVRDAEGVEVWEPGKEPDEDKPVLEWRDE